MNFVALHVDRTQRTARAQRLARAAADAHLLVDHGDLLGSRVVGIQRNHRDGTRRTMPCAVAALLTVTDGHAELTRPYRMAYLDGALLLLRDGLDGTCRAHIGTLRTLRTAVAALVAHLRLHERHQAGGRAKHAVGAGRHAKLARRAMVLHVTGAQRARRGQRGAPWMNLLVDDVGQAAVNLLVRRLLDDLGLGGLHACAQGYSAEDGTERGIGWLAYLGWFCCLFAFLHFCIFAFCVCKSRGKARYGKLVVQGVELALLKAVAAGHAAAVVHRVVPEVNGARLAVARAHAAALALVGVERHVEEAEAADEAKDRAHGADGVAIGSSILISQVAHDDKRGQGDEEGRQRLHPHVGVIEGVALVVLGYTCQQVVAPAVQGLQQVARDAAVAAVGSQQSNERAHAADDGKHEHAQHRVAKHALGWRVSVGNLLLLLGTRLLPYPRYHVLHHAHRADHGTVDAAEEKRQNDEEQNNAHVQRQERGQELNLGHPAEVQMQRPGEVHEQQRNQHEENYGQSQSNLT